MISAPVIRTTSLLVSNRELGGLIPYSLQVTRIIFVGTGINRGAAKGPEDILGFRLGAIPVLELRGPNLIAGVVLNYDLKIPGRGHYLHLSPGDRRLRAEPRRDSNTSVGGQMQTLCGQYGDGMEMRLRPPRLGWRSHSSATLAAASIMGSMIPLAFATALMVGTFTHTAMPGAVTNRFLLIFGYFFGQNVPRTRINRGRARSQSPDSDEFP